MMNWLMKSRGVLIMGLMRAPLYSFVGSASTTN
jgi:hypothetical protein